MSGALKESNPWAPDLDVTVPLEDGTIIDVKPLSFVDSNEPTVVVTQQPVNGTVTPGGDAPGLLVATLSQEGPDEARYTVEDTRGFVSAPAVLRLTGVSQEPDPDPVESDIFRTPFTSASAWNIPIGTGATLAGTGDAQTAEWLKMSGLVMAGDNGYGVGTYPIGGAYTIVSSPSDISYVVADNGEGASIGVPSPSIKIPEVVKTLNWTQHDRHVIIFDPATNTVYDFYHFRWTGSNFEARLLRITNATGLGHGTSSGDRIGTSASGVSLMAGHIAPWMLAEGVEWPQVLQCTVPRNQGGTTNADGCFRMLSTNTQLPATTIDGGASFNTGPIVYGSVFTTLRSLNLDGFGFNEMQRRMAQCIFDRGIMVVDGGGCRAGNFRCRQGVTGEQRTQILAVMTALQPHMRRITNGEWFDGQTARGGGTPLAQNYGVTS